MLSDDEYSKLISEEKIEFIEMDSRVQVYSVDKSNNDFKIKIGLKAKVLIKETKINVTN